MIERHVPVGYALRKILSIRMVIGTALTSEQNRNIIPAIGMPSYLALIFKAFLGVEVMCIVLADGPPSVEIRGDTVSVTLTSGGDAYGFAFRLQDANQAVSDYLEQLGERDGRDANILAYRARG